jgi:DNA-binding response OmpR family regulator
MKKILIVEDDFYIRGLYRMAFEKKGYAVVEAGTGQTALDLIKDEKFDFIVLDLMLPGISGMEVLKTVKRSKNWPVYVLTNVGEEQVLKEAMTRGAKGYFLKVDYTPNQLIAAIEKKEQEVKS